MSTEQQPHNGVQVDDSDEGDNDAEGGSEDDEMRPWAEAMNYRADGSEQMLAEGIDSLVRGHVMMCVVYWYSIQ
jgi:hypothetical protein